MEEKQLVLIFMLICRSELSSELGKCQIRIQHAVRSLDETKENLKRRDQQYRELQDTFMVTTICNSYTYVILLSTFAGHSFTTGAAKGKGEEAALQKPSEGACCLWRGVPVSHGEKS